MLFVALHQDAIGTSETCRKVSYSTAIGGKPDVFCSA
jgi:hypothetical protein